MKIIRVAIDSPLRSSFDYLPPNNVDINQLQPGVRVRVPFGRREIIAIFLETDQKSQVPIAKLKQALEILDTEPLFSKSVFRLCTWAGDYYHHPVGEVLFGALPKALRLGASLKSGNVEKNGVQLDGTPLLLNVEQQQAIEIIHAKSPGVFLLDGITGSGKTEVYLQIIAEVIRNSKQALVLVPEINLTPQTLTRFQERFPNERIAVFHSRMTDKQRLVAWSEARAGMASIIIGTRSALFTSLLNPGIIVLDEEHDLSFKQQSGFRYSARDLAVLRGKLEHVPVILGSATPSLESMQNAFTGRYQHLQLKERVAGAAHPAMRLVDLRKQRLKTGLALPTITAIETCLSKNEQVLLFVNRRGYAPSLLCHYCGFVAGCTKCDVRLTLHQKQQILQCHHCGSTQKIMVRCPKCGSNELLPSGVGTERLEMGLAKLFPGVSLVRVDSDTTRKKGAMETIVNAATSGKCQILVGTQMLTKGHHFPNVTLVVVLNADGGLFSADFRASEYLMQLIIQVAGRAGRAEKAGTVLIQTHNPEHPLLVSLLQHGYPGFVEQVLVERASAAMPPFAYLALVRAASKNRAEAHAFLQSLRDYGQSIAAPNVELSGPVANVIERKANYYQAQLLIQSSNRPALHQVLAALLNYISKLKLTRSTKWSLDVDPMETS